MGQRCADPDLTQVASDGARQRMESIVQKLFAVGEPVGRAGPGLIREMDDQIVFDVVQLKTDSLSTFDLVLDASG